eukprot:760348-Hanusia_phi.AAC.2
MASRFHTLREDETRESSSSIQRADARVFDERFHVLVGAPPVPPEDESRAGDKPPGAGGTGGDEAPEMMKEEAMAREDDGQESRKETEDVSTPPPRVPAPPRPWKPSKTVCAMGLTIFALLIILVVILFLYV